MYKVNTVYLRNEWIIVRYTDSLDERNSLFGRIRELVLSPALVALLHAGISPHAAYSISIALIYSAHFSWIHIKQHRSITLEHINNIKMDPLFIVYVQST